MLAINTALCLILSRNVISQTSIYYNDLEFRYENTDAALDWEWFGNYDTAFYNSQRCPGSWYPCPMIGESVLGSYMYLTIDEVDIHNYKDLTLTYTLSAYHLNADQYCYAQYTYDTPGTSATYTNLLPNLTSGSNTSNVEFANEMRDIPDPPTDDPEAKLTIRFYVAPVITSLWKRCYMSAVSLSGIFESPYPTTLPTYKRLVHLANCLFFYVIFFFFLMSSIIFVHFLLCKLKSKTRNEFFYLFFFYFFVSLGLVVLTFFIFRI